MFRRRFSKEDLHQYALARGILGSWQDKWSLVGCLFFTLFEGGVALIDFPQSSSPNVYVKAGEEFIYVGMAGDGEVKVEYDERLFGEGTYVGFVELPEVMEIVEVGERERGIVGTVWRKVRVDNGSLGREGLIPYREWSKWEGKKVKFRIDLRKYKRYEVRGEKWARIFEQWEKKGEELRKEFFFKEGLPLAERFPPKRKLNLDEWREYVSLLGEHAYWLRKQKEMEDERELRKLIWGRDEIEENEWEGLRIYVPPSSVVGISGPISIFGLMKFLTGDLTGVLERYKTDVPIPCL